MTSKTIYNLVNTRNIQLLAKGSNISAQRCLLTPPTDPPQRTINELIKDLTSQEIGGPAYYDPAGYKVRREALMDILPSSQSQLPPRRMLESYDMAVIPLGADPVLRDRYLLHNGGVRIGRLLEAMDMFAVHTVFKHIYNPKQKDGMKSPYSIVTALVDNIDIKKNIHPERDIKISGHVTWVGKTSAESTLELHQKYDGNWEKVTEALFVLVARNPANTGSAFINPLEIVTEEEKEIYNKGKENQVRRRTMANTSLFTQPPTEEEKVEIHDFFLKTVDHKAMSYRARVLPNNSTWMEDSTLKNLLICQPENRNIFNKIFGGFIMRQAFELAWANAFVYGQARPYCMYMDDIWFRAPVEIGSLLYLNSKICYTTEKFIQTRVSAEILEPQTGKMSVTNVFQYTFKLKEKKPRQIIPKTYHEGMMWLEGKRNFENSMESNTIYKIE